MSTLTIQNLTKKFKYTEKERKVIGIVDKYKTVVDHISFEVNSGDVFGLLGPNGAGKTTIMKMLTTILSPTEGDIFYNGVNVKNNPIGIRSEFAFLTSELKLDQQSTPNEMYDFFAKLYHIPKDVARKRKQALFEKFGILDFADIKIGKLSQGMKQKTSLAISVLHDPQFIIFDEPTNGLDVLAAKDVRDFILSMKDEGKCIIVSTHIFDLIERTCNKVALIIDGKIIRSGAIEDVRCGKTLEDSFYDIYRALLERDE